MHTTKSRNLPLAVAGRSRSVARSPGDQVPASPPPASTAANSAPGVTFTAVEYSTPVALPATATAVPVTPAVLDAFLRLEVRGDRLPKTNLSGPGRVAER